MQIHAITSQNNPKTFKGVRFQNGIKTKNALQQNIKEMLPLIERKCGYLKNVDLIMTDSGKIQLDVATPRYLAKKFQRFYKEENYSTGYYNNGGFAFYEDKSNYYTEIQLSPTEENGIYNVSNYGYKNYNAYLASALKAAELINKVSDKIKEAEKEYGMDCVNVLDNTDKLTEEAERMSMVDKIKSSYVIENEELLESMPEENLKVLADAKLRVDSLKHYKPALLRMIDGASQIGVFLVDINGYIDDKYAAAYKKYGFNIQNINNSRYIKPVNSERIKYSLGAQADGIYYIYKENYNGGELYSNIDSEHFGKFMNFTEKLDSIGDTIEWVNNLGNKENNL